MTPVKIDNHIAPPCSVKSGKRSKYPFADMQVGESFAVSLDERANLRNILSGWKNRHPGWDYATRSDGEFFRIWRTA